KEHDRNLIALFLFALAQLSIPNFLANATQCADPDLFSTLWLYRLYRSLATLTPFALLTVLGLTLSPPAPMVLGTRVPGRVGLCQILI
ncbi:hypothetical protein, partial [Dethiobacter alkaliphilus]|uniref:hypothetical protein n=1 Tax=Dethiobacter alkaliphilus TaxID=427926 RepID=UPI002227CFAB